jgi:sulfofructose kinase
VAIASSVPGLVGVTLGPDGFLWREGATERRVPAPKVVAIDPVAAGDVWHGAFTLALSEGLDVAGAGRFANAAAAIKCSRASGRLGTPLRDEVTTLRSAEW